MQNPTATPKELRRHQAVRAVAFSHDGRWLASGSEDNTYGYGTCTTPRQRQREVLQGHAQASLDRRVQQ